MQPHQPHKPPDFFGGIEAGYQLGLSMARTQAENQQLQQQVLMLQAIQDDGTSKPTRTSL